MIRAASLLAVALGLAACAGPELVLLPGEDGSQGAVVVLESGGREQETIVAQGNSRTRLGSARPVTRAVDPARLTAAERAVLNDLPPAPVTFTLYFQPGTTLLTPESQPQLASLQAEVARRPGVEVQVTGHTDRVGTDEDNDRLSQLRAEEIMGLLAGEGIAREVMTAIGRGERQPLVPTEDNVAEAANRRVEVIVR